MGAPSRGRRPRRSAGDRALGLTRQLPTCRPFPSAQPAHVPITRGPKRSSHAMYQFSRAIYREVAHLIETGEGHDREAHEKVLKACEQALERLAFDRHYFANPTRTLFREIRVFFPVTAQHPGLQAVRRYLAGADEWLLQQPLSTPCRATTRRGTPCPRPPL